MSYSKAVATTYATNRELYCIGLITRAEYLDTIAKKRELSRRRKAVKFQN